ncbi:hypothetical protein Tco_1328402, partial [Tanacetum coccineum]
GNPMMAVDVLTVTKVNDADDVGDIHAACAAGDLGD